MTALFNFQSLLTVVLLSICTATYLRPRFAAFIDPKKAGFPGLFGRFAVIGERLSPYISVGCVVMALVTIFLRYFSFCDFVSIPVTSVVSLWETGVPF